MSIRKKNESNRLKDLIPEMLKENKLQQGVDQFTVKDTWEQIMGQGVSSYTEDVSLKDGVLRVGLSSAPLREELNYGKEKILEMMRSELPEMKIKKILLR